MYAKFSVRVGILEKLLNGRNAPTVRHSSKSYFYCSRVIIIVSKRSTIRASMEQTKNSG